VAILGALFLARRPSARVTAGAVLCAIGAFALTFSSSAQGSSTILAGDAMFLCASALGAIYVLQLRNSGVNALQAAALVTVYSAVLVVPWQLWVAPMPLWRADPLELVWQIVWQGLLTACVSLIAFNHAVTRLGAERACALIAFVPVLSAVFGFAFLGEVPSLTELAAILTVSLGVSIGAARGYGGNPASTRAATSRPA
jgi:drug/metabolite transporter (DMT)-like permease